MFMWSTLVVYSKVIYALALIISTTPIQPKTCIKVAQVLSGLVKLLVDWLHVWACGSGLSQ